jgi:hypothetical protein
MNRVLSSRDAAPRDTRPVRFLLRGPAALRSAAVRWAVTILAVAGAVMLVWSAVIHL